MKTKHIVQLCKLNPKLKLVCAWGGGLVKHDMAKSGETDIESSSLGWQVKREEKSKFLK